MCHILIFVINNIFFILFIRPFYWHFFHSSIAPKNKKFSIKFCFQWAGKLGYWQAFQPYTYSLRPFSTGRAWDAPLSQSIDSDPPSLYGVKVWLKFLRRSDSQTSSSYLSVFRGGILFGVDQWILWFSGPNGCILSSEQIPKLLGHGSVFRGFRELNRSGLPQVCVNYFACCCVTRRGVV